MLSDRFLDAGTYRDPVSGFIVRLTWDMRDKCWRLWKQRHGEWERVPGEDLGSDKTEAGINKAVTTAWAAYEVMVDQDARKRAGLEP